MSHRLIVLILFCVWNLCIHVPGASAADTGKVAALIEEGKFTQETFKRGANRTRQEEMGRLSESTRVYGLDVSAGDLESAEIISLSGLDLEGFFFVEGKKAISPLGRTMISGDVFAYDASTKNLTHAGTGRFAIKGSMVTGRLAVKGMVYAIRPLRNHQHHLHVTPASDFPGDLADTASASELLTAVEQAQPAPLSAVPLVNGKYPVDVLVLFDEWAVCYTADPLALAEFAVAEANDILTNSEIQIEIRLAGWANVAYEAGDSSEDLARIKSLEDGVLDEIHTYRAALGADLVSLFAGSCDVGGRGYLTSSAENAYTVVGTSSLHGNSVFTHEIGHNFGAHHNPEEVDLNPDFYYGYGMYNEESGWRTVMSYDCPGGCSRIPYFSNPDLTYKGDIIGSNTQNNARVLNERAEIVASFKSRPVFECTSYADTVINHLNAGRVYARTIWRRTRYYVAGSDENLGTDPDRIVTLVPNAAGFEVGECREGAPNTTTFENITWQVDRDQSLTLSGQFKEEGDETAAIMITDAADEDLPTLCTMAEGSFTCFIKRVYDEQITYTLRSLSMNGQYSPPSPAVVVENPYTNQPPVVTIDRDSVDVSDEMYIRLVAAVDDVNEDVRGAEIKIAETGDVVSCTDLTGAGTLYQCGWQAAQTGTYHVTVAAYDRAGFSGSDSVDVAVNSGTPPEPSPPVVRINKISVSDQMYVLVEGSVNDPDNDVASVVMEIAGTGDRLSCVFTTRSFTCGWQAPASGTYRLTVTAEDAAGLTGNATDTVDVAGTPECVNHQASLDDHVASSRAHIESSWFRNRYYALGSGDYLGTSGDTMVNLAETSPGYFENAMCP